ncbi:MAG: NAD(P)-dependent oxidoreductase [Deltaproteobacteria bacterium HGW-Deltaproteobacteria-4]|nr:MAG: NAD(P)-dependent oxidoreductase [Deltaproteobacteria bacterium HGW-Deltaproteobacteria-4]
MSTALLIVGYGDIGQRVAALALAAGRTVSVLVRSSEKAAALRADGIAAVLGDLDDTAAPVRELHPAGTTVLYTVPPPGGGEYDVRLRVLLASIEPGQEPEKIVYLSTTGVYGDQQGALVTEETPTKATTSRARRRLDAESLLLSWGRNRGVKIVTLRVSGIYGANRLPLNRLREGAPVLRSEESPFSNRIHADDLSRLCLVAADQGEDGEIINICDGETSTMTDYFNAVADAFSLPRPPQVTMAQAKECMPPLLLSYFSESRRLDNRRMRERLGGELLYPDLASGLAACKKDLV